MTSPSPVSQLRAPVHLASNRARVFWTVRALPGWLVTGLVLGSWLVGGVDASGPVIAGVLIPVAGLALTHLVVMPQWRYRVHRWEITDTAVFTQSGWLTQERRVAPLARVQTVDTHRGPIEQLFGLANVTVTTASAKGPIKIHALDLTVAEHAVEWITARAQAAGGDAT